MGWLIGIELPDELANHGCFLSQSSTELREHRPNTRFYPLKAPLDAVTLRSASNPEALPWELPSEKVRIFKLSGLDLERGIRIQRASTGTFLVIVPPDSRPEGESPEWIVAGPEQVKGTSTPAYLLHFAEVACDAAFITEDGERLPLPRAIAGAELLGSAVDDELTDECGRLFVAEPPRLVLRDGWRPAGFVVVEEPTGERTWRTDGPEFEVLRPEIAAKGCGWFSIRCYDEREERIESLPFRFSASLKKIVIDNPSANALPGPAGHDDAVVRFLHRDGCRVTPGESGPTLHTERESGGTRVLVPRDSRFDVTRWHVAEAQGKVILAVRVERIWWALAAADVVPDSGLEWTDEALDLQRDDFAPTSSRVLHVRLPRADWKASVGFREGRMLPMQGKRGSLQCSLPLRNLTDQRELEATVETPPLRLVARSPRVGTLPPAEVARVGAPAPRSFRPRRVDTAALQPARVASVLTRVARSLRGRQRRVLLTFRRDRYARGRRDCDAVREEFVRQALCFLDALCERDGAPVEGLLRRWRVRADDASRAFPEIREEVERFLARAMDSSLR